MFHKILLVAGAMLVASSASAQTNMTVNYGAILDISAEDFKLFAPLSVPSGLVTLRFTNHGQQLHHAQLLKFAGNHTVKDFVAALKPNAPPPRWASFVGGPNAVGPNGASEVTEILEPGNYGLVCFVDTPDHVPHIMKGMSRDLVVSKPAGKKAALPSGDNTVSLVDYNFKLAHPLVKGWQRLTVSTNATQPHELTVIQLAPGKTSKDLLAWLDKMQGPPPGMLLGGVASLQKGRSVSVPLNLTPGNYVLICFVPDSKDGKPHFMHGMIQEQTVQ